MSLRKLEIKQVQKLELETLSYLDKVCKDLGVEYCLAYGSALGACRHEGFIPWDDDLDVYIRRTDIKRLADYVNSRTDSIFKVLLPLEADGYHHPYPKLTRTDTVLEEPKNNRVEGLGIFIDLFPCDFVRRKTRLFVLKQKAVNYLNKMYCQVYVRNHTGVEFGVLLKKGVSSLFKPLNPIKIHHLIERLAVAGTSYDGDWLTCPYDASYVIKSSEVFPPCLCKFNDRHYLGPREIAKYCEEIYGPEYMVPIKTPQSSHGEAWMKGGCSE